MKKRHVFPIVTLLFAAIIFCGCARTNRNEAVRISDTGGRWAQTVSPGRFVYSLKAAPTPDGGLCIGGETDPIGKSCALEADCKMYFVAKINKSGKLLWTKRNADNLEKWTRSVSAMPDGGCSISGFSDVIPARIPEGKDPTDIFWQIFLARFSVDGELVYNKYYSINDANSMSSTGNQIFDTGGNIILGGSIQTLEKAPHCPWLLKINPENGKLIQAAYDCNKKPLEYQNMFIDKNGIISIFEGRACKKKNNEGQLYYPCYHRFNRMDSSFKTILRKEEPVQEYRDICIKTIAEAPGGIYAAGFNNSTNAGKNLFLIKTDSGFKPVWRKEYNSKAFLEPVSVAATSDGGALIGGNYKTGKRSWAPFLLKTNAKGELQWLKYYDSNRFDFFIAANKNKNGGITAVFSYNVDHSKKVIETVPQFWIVSIDKNGNAPEKLTFDKPQTEKTEE